MVAIWKGKKKEKVVPKAEVKRVRPFQHGYYKTMHSASGAELFLAECQPIKDK